MRLSALSPCPALADPLTRPPRAPEPGEAEPRWRMEGTRAFGVVDNGSMEAMIAAGVDKKSRGKAVWGSAVDLEPFSAPFGVFVGQPPPVPPLVPQYHTIEVSRTVERKNRVPSLPRDYAIAAVKWRPIRDEDRRASLRLEAFGSLVVNPTDDDSRPDLEAVNRLMDIPAWEPRILMVVFALPVLELGRALVSAYSERLAVGDWSMSDVAGILSFVRAGLECALAPMHSPNDTAAAGANAALVPLWSDQWEVDNDFEEEEEEEEPRRRGLSNPLPSPLGEDRLSGAHWEAGEATTAAASFEGEPRADLPQAATTAAASFEGEPRADLPQAATTAAASGADIDDGASHQTQTGLDFGTMEDDALSAPSPTRLVPNPVAVSNWEADTMQARCVRWAIHSDGWKYLAWMLRWVEPPHDEDDDDDDDGDEEGTVRSILRPQSYWDAKSVSAAMKTYQSMATAGSFRGVDTPVAPEADAPPPTVDSMGRLERTESAPVMRSRRLSSTDRDASMDAGGGSDEVPSLRKALPYVDADWTSLFGRLPAASIVVCIQALIHERKVVLISRDTSAAVDASVCIQALLAPLRWYPYHAAGWLPAAAPPHLFAISYPMICGLHPAHTLFGHGDGLLTPGPPPPVGSAASLHPSARLQFETFVAAADKRAAVLAKRLGALHSAAVEQARELRSRESFGSEAPAPPDRKRPPLALPPALRRGLLRACGLPPLAPWARPGGGSIGATDALLPMDIQRPAIAPVIALTDEHSPREGSSDPRVLATASGAVAAARWSSARERSVALVGAGPTRSDGGRASSVFSDDESDGVSDADEDDVGGIQPSHRQFQQGWMEVTAAVMPEGEPCIDWFPSITGPPPPMPQGKDLLKELRRKAEDMMREDTSMVVLVDLDSGEVDGEPCDPDARLPSRLLTRMYQALTAFAPLWAMRTRDVNFAAHTPDLPPWATKPEQEGLDQAYTRWQRILDIVVKAASLADDTAAEEAEKRWEKLMARLDRAEREAGLVTSSGEHVPPDQRLYHGDPLSSWERLCEATSTELWGEKEAGSEYTSHRRPSIHPTSSAAAASALGSTDESMEMVDVDALLREQPEFHGHLEHVKAMRTNLGLTPAEVVSIAESVGSVGWDSPAGADTEDVVHPHAHLPQSYGEMRRGFSSRSESISRKSSVFRDRETAESAAAALAEDLATMDEAIAEVDEEEQEDAIRRSRITPLSSPGSIGVERIHSGAIGGLLSEFWGNISSGLTETELRLLRPSVTHVDSHSIRHASMHALELSRASGIVPRGAIATVNTLAALSGDPDNGVIDQLKRDHGEIRLLAGAVNDTTAVDGGGFTSVGSYQGVIGVEALPVVISSPGAPWGEWRQARDVQRQLAVHGQLQREASGTSFPGLTLPSLWESYGVKTGWECEQPEGGVFSVVSRVEQKRREMRRRRLGSDEEDDEEEEVEAPPPAPGHCIPRHAQMSHLADRVPRKADAPTPPITLNGHSLRPLSQKGLLRRELIRQALSMPVDAAGSSAVYTLERRLLATGHLRLAITSVFVSLFKSFRMYIRGEDVTPPGEGSTAASSVKRSKFNESFDIDMFLAEAEATDAQNVLAAARQHVPFMSFVTERALLATKTRPAAIALRAAIEAQMSVQLLARASDDDGSIGRSTSRMQAARAALRVELNSVDAFDAWAFARMTHVSGQHDVFSKRRIQNLACVAVGADARMMFRPASSLGALFEGLLGSTHTRGGEPFWRLVSLEGRTIVWYDKPEDLIRVDEDFRAIADSGSAHVEEDLRRLSSLRKEFFEKPSGSFVLTPGATRLVVPTEKAFPTEFAIHVMPVRDEKSGVTLCFENASTLREWIQNIRARLQTHSYRRMVRNTYLEPPKYSDDTLRMLEAARREMMERAGRDLMKPVAAATDGAVLHSN
jgi:hypothetical protein